MLTTMYLATAALSAGVTASLVRWQRRIPIMDTPNARSSHQFPKPRTGGIAIFIAFLCGYLAWTWLSGARLEGKDNVCVLAGAAAFFLLGLVEDIRHLPEWFRFLMQATLSLAVAATGPKLDSLEIPGLGVRALPPALALGLTTFWYTGFVNLFNFLDGIDGYAAGEAALVGLMMAAVSAPLWPLLVSASALGFLLLNRQPSRIFMGDSGSYLLGYLLAVLSVIGSTRSAAPVPFAVYVLFLGTFIADATVTLARRIVRGERWFKAHRSHYYQKLTDLEFSHGQVSLMNLGMTTLLGGSGWLYIRSAPAWRGALLLGWALAFACAFIEIHKQETP